VTYADWVNYIDAARAQHIAAYTKYWRVNSRYLLWLAKMAMYMFPGNKYKAFRVIKLLKYWTTNKSQQDSWLFLYPVSTFNGYAVCSLCIWLCCDYFQSNCLFSCFVSLFACVSLNCIWAELSNSLYIYLHCLNKKDKILTSLLPLKHIYCCKFQTHENSSSQRVIT